MRKCGNQEARMISMGDSTAGKLFLKWLVSGSADCAWLCSFFFFILALPCLHFSVKAFKIISLHFSTEYCYHVVSRADLPSSLNQEHEMYVVSTYILLTLTKNKHLRFKLNAVIKMCVKTVFQFFIFFCSCFFLHLRKFLPYQIATKISLPHFLNTCMSWRDKSDKKKLTIWSLQTALSRTAVPLL